MPDEELAPRWSRDGKGRAQWPLRRWLSVAIGVLVLVFVGSIVAGALAIANLTEARTTIVDRVDPAVQEALRLDTALVDQETGLRGYALTAQTNFLEPYTSGVGRQDAAIARLRQIIMVRADLLDRIRGIETEIGRWRTDYAEPSIERIRAAGATGGDQTSEGKIRFDQVRAAVGGLQRELDAARARGRDALSSAANLLVVVCALIAAVLLVVFLLVTIALRAAVAGPLAQLARGVRRVADGDFEHELRVSGPREVTELAGDVDSMRRRILDEVSVQREVNAELDTRTEDLARSNAELEQFAYVASHDLQEPLRKVASFCQLLERRYKGQLDDRADQYIGFAVDGAKRMQVLINDLLAFSRVGRHVRDRGPVDCAELVAQATANLANAVEESGAVVETGAGLPTVLGEAPLLTAVFQNLIGNAVKFRGEAAPVVRVEAERDGDNWLFSVSDNGIGIEPEFAERVFVIFQRLHGKDAYPGTGIGLAMCRKIIEYHGGRIWLATDTERGTRFRFTLPVVAADTLGETTPEKAETT
ncbi:sensor histidine kinase [Actinokineospora sp. NBRC 105648]|uniref:sensor histidine kinase n=1 Tax=Actinokineospora sp. NBRC 105648 TaxID=3032206 RepID=UPI0024A168F6|nr:sensor histidine kinase [Actinokineospora sp. NBRC 105648]GLZ37346.1 histidine kinase [Actinokineospora sp. NBRC 105648]